MIAHNCDAAAAGMFQTAGGKPGVYTFGVNADENGKAPNVLSSAFLDIPKAFADIAKSVRTARSRASRSAGPEVRRRAPDGQPQAGERHPGGGKAKIQQAEQQIAAGTLKVSGP